ncbi:DnaD domain-containing protein [Atopococcus tabaci]|uniref:DnaD domain-containing protein n=1 Tax=Atopococcus tabaci TaxID=269774 RepID=UPI00040ED4B7|nr:DnaD domain-containing protein [Atopococcus tabaci]
MDHHLLMKWMQSGMTVVPTVLLEHYQNIGLSTEEFVLLVHLKSFLDKGETFPDIEEIAQRMGLTSEKTFEMIHRLIHKKVLEIQTGSDEEGKSKDTYSLDLLWEKLAVQLTQQTTKKVQQEEVHSEERLFRTFEEEFGRPLSPIELQTIGMWLDEDKYPLELIEMALREAVLNQVYSLKYVDRILLNWEKKNIRSKAQVEKESQSYRNKKMADNGQNDQQKPTKPVPLHNWLDDEK